ncbi:permease [Psychromonas sp. psych-6C06]|uniref:sulfite exporter TauE/SafE family protein n=1 Tax=Psychromonas sp. psych-6C06 TaxID=2058089 RepID=UPI000C339C63|nr:sulfite exporter TauE/SafE family protein [Psychromonas sp. psych-6C06]PKF61002.1 permease [Psychromonas sp. psych-6C06]
MESQILIAMLLVFTGAFIQSATGFGLAVVASPLLIMLSPEYIPGPIIVVGFFLALINTIKYRGTISIGGLKHAVIGRIPGSVVGGMLLFYIDTAQLSLLLGIVVLLAVFISLLPIKLQPTRHRLLFAGFLSGFLGTSSGIGGPPMALLLQHQQANFIRANLAAFFLISCTMSLMVQIPIGYMSIKHLLLALPLLPAAYLGYRFAQLFMDRISQKVVRYTSLILCLIAGLGATYSGASAIL